MPWGMSLSAVIVDTILTLSTIQNNSAFLFVWNIPKSNGFKTFFGGKRHNRVWSLVQVTNGVTITCRSMEACKPLLQLIYFCCLHDTFVLVSLWTEVNKIIAYCKLKLCAQCVLVPLAIDITKLWSVHKNYSTWEQHFSSVILRRPRSSLLPRSLSVGPHQPLAAFSLTYYTK